MAGQRDAQTVGLLIGTADLLVAGGRRLPPSLLRSEELALQSRQVGRNLQSMTAAYSGHLTRSRQFTVLGLAVVT
jgi:hypothetical protein